jgi:acetyl-CoA carboxylase biotin carboxyl carrier protein
MSNKGPDIDKKLIRELADILNETDLSEIEVEHGELRIRVSRQGSPMMMPMPSYAAPAAMPIAAAPVSAVGASEKAATSKGDAVPSPMVGTVYLSAAPGAKPYVSVGDKVKEGQTILIIEAMKTMNQIPAPRAGTITAILVDDSQPVEFGEPLVTIE